MREPIDLSRYFWRNAAAITVSEFFWGLGLPIILESTFVTIFLTSVGASNSEIGITGSIFSICFAIFPFAASYLTANMPYKRGPTIYIQLIPSVAVMLMGAFYWFFGTKENAYPVFLLFYAAFAAGLALTVPVWQNFVVKIFTPKDSVRGMSIMMIGQNSAKLISGTLMTFALSYAAMGIKSAGIFFFLSGSVFFIGSCCFIFARENRGNGLPAAPPA